MSDQKRTTPGELLQRRQVYTSGEVEAAGRLTVGVWGCTVDAPKAITLECSDPKCSAKMVWDLKTEVALFAAPTVVKFSTLVYRCRHCRNGWIQYELAAGHTSDSSMTVLVYGIYPRQYPGVSPTVIAALGEDDGVLYVHAVQSRSAGMGLGALAYLRRVVENAINLLLDLLASVLSDSEDPRHQEYVAQVEWLKGQKAFDKKAGAAAAVLPRSFFAGGHNPFARLHDWASVGVHNEPDAECCDLFDEIRDVFEALFERLESEKETRRLYADRLAKISKRVPQNAVPKKE